MAMDKVLGQTFMPRILTFSPPNPDPDMCGSIGAAATECANRDCEDKCRSVTIVIETGHASIGLRFDVDEAQHFAKRLQSVIDRQKADANA